MSDANIVNIMREHFKTMEDGDVEKGISLWAEDGVWITVSGTFEGEAEIMRYLAWHAEIIKDMKITETGNGIIVQGDKAFAEHIIAGSMKGRRGEVLAMSAWEFSNGKIQRISMAMDRLLIAKQAAKGWFSRWLVNFIVKQGENGLR